MGFLNFRGDAKLRNHLLKLVHPEVETLAPLWLSALRDHVCKKVLY